jgi:LmbE family N-acetylglucosaminyl deacetylase/CheY-like chemotaxis protein
MSAPYRVIIIEDDLDVAQFTKTVLEKRLGCVVLTISDPAQVRAGVLDFTPDVVITDIEMPGASGLDLISVIRDAQRDTPVIVMTAHVSIDYALSALRNHADEFLTKPVTSADLVNHVERLAREFRTPKNAASKRQVVLAIGAHPDDVEVGVGGILAAHRAAGDAVTILTLSRGYRAGGLKTAWAEGSASAEVIGARVILEDSPEPILGGAELIVRTIRRVVEELNPTIVYVHSNNDRHQDHRSVHEAALLATGSARTFACYQSSSSTVEFHPNRFVTIDDYLDAKLGMLECFAPEPDRPRYLDRHFVTATARYWSRYGQGAACEPLEVLRESADVL